MGVKEKISAKSVEVAKDILKDFNYIEALGVLDIAKVLIETEKKG